jgi:tRNA(Ile)-lysidine synthase
VTTDLLELDLPAGVPLAVGVSGGADSVALLALLAAVGRWPLQVVQVDHGLRADSGAEAGVVAVVIQRLAQRYATPMALHPRRLGPLSTARRGVESAARSARYEALIEVARLTGAPAVLTAHHADDQAETILLQLLRGCGSLAAAGMATQRPLAPGVVLLRPLLAQPRAVLRAWLAGQDLPWCEDSSNADPRFARNRLRLRVLPTLEAGCPGIGAALAQRAAAQAAAHAAQVRSLEARLGDAARLEASAWADLDDAARRLLWNLLARRHGWRRSRAAIARLDALALGPPGARLVLGRTRLLRDAGGLRWGGPPSRAAVTVPTPGSVQRGFASLHLDAVQPPADPRSGPEQAWLDADTLVGPLVWRPPQPGERHRPLGLAGSVRAVRILSQLRRHLPLADGVLADDHGIVWIPGHRIAERCRITAATRQAWRCRWQFSASV